MSETVHYRGKLREIESFSTILTINDIAKSICISLNIEGDDFWEEYYLDDYLYLLCDKAPDTYISVNNRLFEIETKEEVDIDADIIEVSDNKDGTFNYDMKWYNGGGSFDEVVEQGFNKLNK